MVDGKNRIEFRDALIGGAVAIAVGTFIIAISIWGDDSGFHAPRWVVGAAGSTFLLSGLAIIGQEHPLVSGFIRALLLTTFGAVFTWVSFGPGDREFTSTVSIPFLSVSRSASDISGRICFAPGALLLDGWALYSWFVWGREWFLRDLRD